MSATLGAPRPERPYEGLLQVTTEISPMAGVEYDAGGVAGASEARERETLFDRLVERAVRHTEAVDREALCLIAGKVVWCVNLTLHLLADEGAALDAAVFASIAALRHYRRPDVSIEGGHVTVHSTNERVPVPLACHHSPLAVTYAVFNVQPQTESQRSMLWAHGRSANMEVEGAIPDIYVPVTLLDPSLIEHTLAETSITFVLNAQKEVCVLDKAGGISLPYQTILELMNDAALRVADLSRLLDSVLAADAEKRVVSVL